MDNNLYKIEKSLRSIAKRYKSVKYSLGLAILFLMLGVSVFSEEVNTIQENTVPTREEISSSKEKLRNSVASLQSKIDSARAENEKDLAGLKLELIQLMEQGDQVVKSPWRSWQFGVNYMYSKWNATYKGKGDKSEKYPYEGIYTRSSELFLRNVSPDSEMYEEYIASVKDTSLNSATTSTIKKRGGSIGYGLASTSMATEPLVGFEISAGVNPRNINKSPITISDKIGITPVLPEAISFTLPKPIIKLPVLPDLPVPPSFNIKLGSFCNGMAGNGCKSYDTDGGQYGYGTLKAIGTPRTLLVGGIFIGYVNTVTLNTNDPSLTHG